MPNSLGVAGVPVQTARAFSASFVDWRGERRASSIILPAAATDAEINALSLSLGSASNAALVERHNDTFARVINVADPQVEAFDEAYDNVGWVAVFAFQNGVGTVQAIELPAPDASLFLEDGKTIDPTAVLSAGIIAGALTALNAGDPAGDYIFTRGYVAQRKVKTSRSKVRPGAFVEPAGLDLPGDEPGV